MACPTSASTSPASAIIAAWNPSRSSEWEASTKRERSSLPSASSASSRIILTRSRSRFIHCLPFTEREVSFQHSRYLTFQHRSISYAFSTRLFNNREVFNMHLTSTLTLRASRRRRVGATPRRPFLSFSFLCIKSHCSRMRAHCIRMRSHCSRMSHEDPCQRARAAALRCSRWAVTRSALRSMRWLDSAPSSTMTRPRRTSTRKNSATSSTESRSSVTATFSMSLSVSTASEWEGSDASASHSSQKRPYPATPHSRMRRRHLGSLAALESWAKYSRGFSSKLAPRDLPHMRSPHPENPGHEVDEGHGHE
nr:MAG TPA: hypothetical protein [Caudoviricetes sp.]